jgi:ribosomal protein S18 acetylase RimI-like enzyme
VAAGQSVVRTTIRRMELEDLPAVYRLGLRCWDVLDKPYNYWSIREVAEHLETEPELSFVAVEDSVVVGFVLGADSYEILEDTGHLEWVAVAPENRGDGLGGRLIETFVEVLRSRGRREVVADVSSKNEASHAVFERAGFHEGIQITFFTRRLSE